MALVSKTFSQIITFTRASTATYFDSAGVLQSAAIDAQRLDYNPSTLAAQGLLIEESRTNLVLRSEEFATTWTTSSSSITPNSSTAPNGTVTMDTLVENAALGIHFVEQGISGLTASATYTTTVFVKFPSNNRRFVLQITDAALGGTGYASTEVSVAGAFISAATSGSFTNASGSSTSVGGGIFRVVLTATISTTTSIRVRCLLADSTGAQNYTGDGVSGVFIWGAQLEAGAFPTSYIPTTTTSLTRAADVASVNTLSPWYNATEGTLYADVALLSSSYTSGLAADLGAGGAFGTTEYIAWSGTAWTLSPNVAPINVISSVTTTSTAKVAAAIKANDSVIAANGLLGVTDTSCGIASAPTTLSLGKAGWTAGNYLNGYLRRITYYPRRLSNAELQAITA